MLRIIPAIDGAPPDQEAIRAFAFPSSRARIHAEHSRRYDMTMPELLIPVVGIVGRLLSASVAWLGKHAFNTVDVHFARACAMALESALESALARKDSAEELDEASFALLQSVLLSSFESADLLGDVLLRPLSGHPLPSAALTQVIYEGFCDRGGDPETAPVDVRKLIGRFVEGLPTAVRLVAAEPGNPLQGYSLHALLLSKNQDQERVQFRTEDALGAEVADVLSEEKLDAFRQWLSNGEATRDDLDSFRAALRDVAARRHENVHPGLRQFVFPEGTHPGILVENRTVRTIQARNVTFSDIVSFDRCKFLGPIAFIECTFESIATFAGAHFHGAVSFRGSHFRETPDFAGTTFDSVLSFQDCEFELGATFSRDVGQDAEPAKFNGLVVASGATFGSRSDFSRTEFRGFLEAERIVAFSSVSMRFSNFAQGGTLAGSELMGALELQGSTVGQGNLTLTRLKAHHVEWPEGGQSGEQFIGVETVQENGRFW